MKKLICVTLAVIMLFSVCSCGFDLSGLPSLLTGLEGLEELFETGDETGQGGDQPAAGLTEGKWPEAVYSKLGVSMIPTANGKIVFTQLTNEGSYQYRVKIHGVTQAEVPSWVDGMLEKGYRMTERDRERINGTYDHDTMLYLPNEKQPYRVRLSYDFGQDMEDEYYWDGEPTPYVLTEKDDGYGETRTYIVYNLEISLNPMKTEREITGEYEELGLKASDLDVNENLRCVEIAKGSYMSSINFRFYSDHVTTEEDVKACRDAVIDKLAANGGVFRPTFNPDATLTADELKAGTGGYTVDVNGGRYMITVNPDSAYGDFGDGYGLIVQKSN